MEKFRVYGASTKEESKRERDHRVIARRAAAEGMVLLKNDGILPFRTKKIALYGPGSRMTVKGGSGSGDVHERHSVTVEEGLKNAGFTFPTTLWMDRFSEKYSRDKALWKQGVEEKIKGYGPIRTMKMFDIIHENPMPYPACTPVLADELTNETDTAVYVLARQAGEGGDRRCEKGEYLLSDVERESIQMLAAHYKNLLLVLNCGSIVDLSILDEVENIGAVLFYAQGGMEGGNAFADIVSGKATPSGKLTDTWAMRYGDYPSAATYSYQNGVLDYEDYTEGIYIGYRWFEAERIVPRFPFGFGLSYTNFQMEVSGITLKQTLVSVSIRVTNTGKEFCGKEVVQIYLAKPKGLLDHEVKGLAAFAKTKKLAPQEEEMLTLRFDLAQQASFDESAGAWILEAGEYGVFVGNSSHEACPCGVLVLPETVQTEKTEHICTKQQTFADYKPQYADEGYDAALPRLIIDPSTFRTVTHNYELPKETEPPKLRRLLDKLTEQEMVSLCVGGGYKLRCFNNVPGACGMTTTELLKRGIPNIVFSDGPAGLNVSQATVILKDGTPRYPDGLPEDWKWGYLKKLEPLVRAKPGKGRAVYHYMTAWPSETLQAQSWNTALLEEIGNAIGREMAEIGVTVWLAPGMNLHRNPLCGRNFEYYSEDPVVSGKMAAAITRGVQSVAGCGVAIKHFCCNNQEDNRTCVSENVSERALRELYLRGFSIAVKEAHPWTVMTSYNKVNDVYTANSHDLCVKALRCEWGFEGLVMSDWNATDQCSHAAAICAGNDLIMPGNKWVRKNLIQALKTGELKLDALRSSAARVLKLIFDSAVAEGF